MTLTKLFKMAFFGALTKNISKLRIFKKPEIAIHNFHIARINFKFSLENFCSICIDLCYYYYSFIMSKILI